MATQEENQSAQDQLEAEMKQFGIETANPSQTEEPNEEESAQETESEPAESEDEEESQESESDDSEDEDEDEAEDDDEEESDEDESEDEQPTRTFKPNSEWKNRRAKERAEKQKYLDTIAALEAELEETRKNQKPFLDPEIEQLAKERGIEDPETLQRIVEISRKGVKVEDNSDLKEKVAEMERELFVAKEQNHYLAEWERFEPTFRNQFPNATDEQLAEAQLKMDELSHSKQWHQYDLDYIFFKNKDSFDFADTPKKKGLESGRSIGIQEEKDKGWKLPDDPSDNDIKDMEKRLAEIASAPSTRVLPQ